MATGNEKDTFQSEEGEENTICKLCLKKPSSYTCPRCNIRYCSSECYKCLAHAQCSESFYRDCFMEGLKDVNARVDDRQKVLEMLARLEDEDQGLDSDDDVGDLEERLQGLDLDKDTDAVWEKLNNQEKKEFKAMLEDGRLGNLVDLWEPWWNKKSASLVEEVQAPEHPGLNHPPILRTIPDLNTVMKSPPSSSICYTVVNLLYAYAYVARLHNGELTELAVQCAQEVLDIAKGLTDQTFGSASEAIQGCFHCLQNKAKNQFVSQEFSVAVMSDVKNIIQGPSQRAGLSYIMAALSDLHSLCYKAKKSVIKDLKKYSSDAKRGAGLKEEKHQWFSACKKLEFLLSWTHKYGLQMENLVPDIEIEFCTLSTELGTHQRDKEKLEKSWGGMRPPAKLNRFIEDITDLPR